MGFKPYTAAAILGLSLTACAPPTLYDWGGYDHALYRYYREPAEQEAFLRVLETIIETNDTRCP